MVSPKIRAIFPLYSITEEKVIKKYLPHSIVFLLVVNSIFLSTSLSIIVRREGGVVQALGLITKGENQVIDSSETKVPLKEEKKDKDKVLLDAPIIKQFPELPRGCEVTSLAMLLQFNGVNVDKLELAASVKKNSTPQIKKDGKIYWGNPNDGYIGDMYSYDNPGYGVYHKPIAELAEMYLPGRIIDLTGVDFSTLKTYLSLNIPVWVITNTTFRPLPDFFFEKWETPTGTVSITYKEHSVLITGYDKDYIYFNDPITGIKNRKEPYASFQQSWEQMGKQAIVASPSL